MNFVDLDADFTQNAMIFEIPWPLHGFDKLALSLSKMTPAEKALTFRDLIEESNPLLAGVGILAITSDPAYRRMLIQATHPDFPPTAPGATVLRSQIDRQFLDEWASNYLVCAQF
jgi:hypothetical protein